MSLEQSWKESSQTDQDLTSMLNAGFRRIPSKDPLQKIRRNLLGGIILGVLIAIIYVIVMYKFPVWQVFISIGTVFLFTVWATVRSFRLYREITTTIEGASLLRQLETYYESLKRWMRIQESVALWIYPASAAGGFMIGGSIGAGKSIDEVMQKPVMIIFLLIVVALLVPLCFLLTRFLTRKMFGRYTQQLKDNIDILKSEQ
jgi:Flp pilus assembly protein TadB